MNFSLSPQVFAALEKELQDSHQAVMTPAPTATNGDESGTITHDSVVAEYTYDYHSDVLNVTVKQGGNWLVNHVIHSKVQAAIDALNEK